MSGRRALLGGEYDAPFVVLGSNPARSTLDPRGLTPPPLLTAVTYTGTDPAIGAVLRGRTSREAGIVYAVDATGNVAQVRMHGGVAFTVAETLDNETAGGTITADAVAVSGNTPNHLPQAVMGDPATGFAGYLGKYKTPALARRRCELQANNLTTTFRNLGWESALTLTGALSNQQRAFGPSIRFTTAAAIGDWCGLRGTGLNTHSPRWDPMLACFWRMQTATNARIWIAASNVALNAVQTPSGAANRVAGFRIDGSVDNNIHCITWDGTTLVDQTAQYQGANLQGASTTAYLFWIELDKITNTARFYVYNWELGVNYGQVAEIAYVTAGADRFDAEIVVECVGAAVAQNIEVSRVFMETD